MPPSSQRVSANSVQIWVHNLLDKGFCRFVPESAEDVVIAWTWLRAGYVGLEGVGDEVEAYPTIEGLETMRKATGWQG